MPPIDIREQRASDGDDTRSQPRARYKRPELRGTEDITTPRLDLRKFKARDAGRMAEMSRDEQTRKFFLGEGFANEAEADDTIAAWRVQYSNEDFMVWCMQGAEEKLLMGKICAHADIEAASAEVEYSVHPEARGKGYASEALEHVIAYLHDCGIRRVHARISTENAASCRCAEKAGMELEGIASDALIDRNGYFYDVAIYAHVG